MASVLGLLFLAALLNLGAVGFLVLCAVVGAIVGYREGKAERK